MKTFLLILVSFIVGIFSHRTYVEYNSQKMLSSNLELRKALEEYCNEQN